MHSTNKASMRNFKLHCSVYLSWATVIISHRRPVGSSQPHWQSSTERKGENALGNQQIETEGIGGQTIISVRLSLASAASVLAICI